MRKRVDAGASRLLLDEAPIAVSRSLALLLGLDEATLLQQVHFRCLSGQSDHRSRWVVCEHDGHYWVSWTPGGMLQDIPLGKTLSPHRRALAELRSARIIRVQQLEKSRWNRANFYRIDYQVLNEALASTERSRDRASTPDGLEDEFRNVDFLQVEDLADGHSNAVKDGSPDPDRKNEKAEIKEERDSSQHSHSEPSLLPGMLPIRRRLARLVGKGPKDNQDWDRRRISVIVDAIESGAMATADVEAILDDPEIRYLSQVQKRMEQISQKREQERRSAEAAAKATREEKQLTQAASAARVAEEGARRKLEAATPEDLHALSERIAGTFPIASVAQAAREAISARQLGSGMVRALVLAALRPVEPCAQADDGGAAASRTLAPSPSVAGVAR